MKILTKYLLARYLRVFFVILVSLEFFFVGIDFFQKYKSIPSSANLQVLYILYNGFFTLTLALPLSLIFAWIACLVSFIKSNEHVAFLSLGISYKNIIKPIVLISCSLLFVLIALQSTPLAYSFNQKNKILDRHYFSDVKEDIFLKYNNYFVYFEKLYPNQKRATGILIYRLNTDKNDVMQTIIAKKAHFQNDRWYIEDAKVITKPQIRDWKSAKLKVSHKDFLYTLEGFKPKILDNVYKNESNLSILDAVYALSLFHEQGVNTAKIRGSLYFQIIIAFFIIPLIFLIYSFASVNSRFFSSGIFVSSSILLTLIVWGIFFILNRLSSGGFASPELMLLLPMLVFLVISYLFYKKNTSFKNAS